MNTVCGAMLSLTIAIGGLGCSAQEVAVPFRQIERSEQLSSSLKMPGNEIAGSLSSSSSSQGVVPAEPSAEGFVRVYPVQAPRTLDSRFCLLNGLHLGMAVFDVAMTQRCIADHSCREGNPIMPSSLAGQLGVNFALVSYSSFVSYKLKKRGSNLWWISPAIGAAAHGVGAATGLANQ